MRRVWATALAGLALAAAQPAGAGWMWQHDRSDAWGPPFMVYGPPVLVYPPTPPIMAYTSPQAGYVAQPAPLKAVPVSPPFSDSAGHYCREYRTTLTIGGRPQPRYATACQQPDGSWRLMN